MIERADETPVRCTPVTFSAAEVDRIRVELERHQMAGRCPRCSTPLRVGPAAEGNGGTVREVWCPECKRCVMLLDG